MPASVQDFVQAEATVRIAQGDEFIDVNYRPHLITASNFQKLDRQVEEGDTNAAAKLMCEVITRWDLMGPLTEWVPEKVDGKIAYDDDGNEKGQYVEIVGSGEIIPLQPRYLAAIPTGYMMSIWMKIQEDVMPDPQMRRGRGSRRR